MAGVTTLTRIKKVNDISSGVTCNEGSYWVANWEHMQGFSPNNASLLTEEMFLHNAKKITSTLSEHQQHRVIRAYEPLKQGSGREEARR